MRFASRKMSLDGNDLLDIPPIVYPQWTNITPLPKHPSTTNTNKLSPSIYPMWMPLARIRRLQANNIQSTNPRSQVPDYRHFPTLRIYPERRQPLLLQRETPILIRSDDNNDVTVNIDNVIDSQNNNPEERPDIFNDSNDHDLSFSALISKHVNSLTDKISTGQSMDISDIFMAAYNTRIIEDPFIFYNIEINSKMKNVIMFDLSNNILNINPIPFLKLYTTYKKIKCKMIYLAYLGLAIHYYVNLKLQRPGAYSLDITLDYSKPYNDIFENIASLIFSEE